LEGAGISFEEADLIMMPVNTVDINDVETAAKIIKLIDLFEDHDDVQRVYTNMNIPDEILEQLS
jgi:transcriptional/translational regulatory protein YebC/TACO1